MRPELPCRADRYILIVDDDPATRQVLADALTGDGYAVGVASNGEEAWDQIVRRSPDLILLDLLMPGYDGRYVAEQLHLHHVNVPVVLMTAGLGGTQAAAQLGISDVLAKPFDLSDLFSLVERLLPATSR